MAGDAFGRSAPQRGPNRRRRRGDRRWRAETDASKLPPFAGAVAQLGERSVRNAEVVGSTPIGSTNAPIASSPGTIQFERNRPFRSMFLVFAYPNRPMASRML